MVKTILITGATGFIGAALCRVILNTTDWNIVGLIRCSSAGNEARLNKYNTKRLRLIHHDLRSHVNEHVSNRIGDVDYIAHLAACSDVDASIKDPLNCVLDNVVGTTNILNYARTKKIEKFLYFSTDEVFGAAYRLKDGTLNLYKEWDRYKSGNPYSASKAGAEELTLAYHNTYKVPALITHTMNVIGPYQAPNKFVPLCINKILKGETIQVHGDADGNSGSRFYIYCDDVARSVIKLLEAGEVGEKYNIVGDEEILGTEMVSKIAHILGKLVSYNLVNHYTSSRPGHDMHYSLDGSKVKKLLGLKFLNFEEALERTVDFYKMNREWLI